MVLMQPARKAEAKHGQEKCYNFCASKSGVVSDVPFDHEGNTHPDPEAPAWEPWTKWVEMQQQLMAAAKGAQNATKHSQQGSNWSQRNNNQRTSNNVPRTQR